MSSDFKLNLHTTHILIVSFASVIILGTVLLMLPFANVGEPLSFLDSLFMATSATCVTGLTLIDIGTELTFAGQIVILVLMQLGGLGIMTFSTIIIFFTGKSMPLKEKTILRDSFVQFSAKELFSIVKYVFLITFLIELFGSIVLFLKWSGKYPTFKAVYYAVFHSISAFCNAGFSLFPNGLIDYSNEIVVPMTVSFLIILGGLGFFVLLELKNIIFAKRTKQKLRISLHTKITVYTSFILILVGAVLFFVLEHNNSLSDKTFLLKITNSFFQSVTTRTAGFATVDFAKITNAYLFLTLIFMFIGASPGSTGGGIKTTSIGIFFAMVKAKLNAREDISIFKRTIPPEVVAKSVSIIFSSVFILILFCVMLLISELGHISFLESKGEFLEIVFEVFSAFGTVGLSTGYTAKFSGFGRFILVLLMFIGRVGPLTIATAVSKKKPKGQFSYSEESVMVG